MVIGCLILLFLWFRPQGILPERRRKLSTRPLPPETTAPDAVAARPMPRIAGGSGPTGLAEPEVILECRDLGSLTDTPRLPVRRLSIRPSQGRCAVGPPLTCSLGTLHAGAHVTVTITVVATVTGTQTNTAAVTSASRDPHPQTSVAAARTRIVAPAPPPRRPPPKVTG